MRRSPGRLVRVSPAADRADDLVGGVLLDVVAGAFEEDGPVIGEELLPASPFACAERDVLRRPHDQRWATAQRGQSFFDGCEERPAGEDLSWEDCRRPARTGRRE